MDVFGIRYVWLYGSAELTLYFKPSGLKGGDEGITFLLATLFLFFSLCHVHHYNL